MRVYFGSDLVYQSQPKQFVFHTAVRNGVMKNGPRKLLYGGAAGGGKTEALKWEIWRWATDTRFPKLTIAVFRKTYPELEKYFINPALSDFPNPEGQIYSYHSQKHTMTFHETGTVVEFNSCEREADVYKYQGAAWDILIIDELTHFTEYQYKYLQTRNRGSKAGRACGFRPLFVAATNPGNVGHAFVKRLFVLKNEYLMGEGGAGNYLFVPAKVWDNRYITEGDPEYIEKLEALPEYERRALLEGDWNIFAGQYFTEIRDEIHGFDPYPLEKGFPRFIALDYGYFPHPAAVGWYAVDELGILRRYKELVGQRLDFEDLARKIVKMCTPDEIEAIAKDFIWASPDIFAKRGNNKGKSGAEEMQNVFDEMNTGWLIVPADNDRINGWRMMHKYLKPLKVGKETMARLMVARTCLTWWTSVPQLQHDPNRPDDVRKTNVTEEGKLSDGDDCGDETRYAIMSRHPEKYKKGEKKAERDRYGAVKKKTPQGIVDEHGVPRTRSTYKRPEYYGFKKPQSDDGL